MDPVPKKPTSSLIPTACRPHSTRAGCVGSSKIAANADEVRHQRPPLDSKRGTGADTAQLRKSASERQQAKPPAAAPALAIGGARRAGRIDMRAIGLFIERIDVCHAMQHLISIGTPQGTRHRCYGERLLGCNLSIGHVHRGIQRHLRIRPTGNRDCGAKIARVPDAV